MDDISESKTELVGCSWWAMAVDSDVANSLQLPCFFSFLLRIHLLFSLR